MKRIIAFLASAFLLPVVLLAQTPQAITYQAVARDGSGNPLANQAIGVRITIKDGSSSGTTVYQETESSVTTNQFGLFTIQIGNGTVVSGTFSAINWSVNSKYIEVEFDPAGGTSYLDMGTTQLLSVPYALYSAQAGKSKDSLNLNGNQLSIVGGNTVFLPSGTGGGGDNWGTQTAVTNSTLQGNGTDTLPLGLAKQGATNGQVLKWNGSNWAPSSDLNTTYTAGTGISISGANNVIANTMTITSAGATKVTGTSPNFIVSSVDSQQLSLQGNTLSLTNGGSVLLPAGTTYSAGSGLNLSGTIFSLAQQGATTNQVLKWNGTSWAPAADATGPTYTAGTNITISGGNVISTPTVTLTGSGGTTVTPGTYPGFTISSPSQLSLTGTGGTTVTGTYPNLTVNSTAPTTYTAGSGLSLTGTAFSLAQQGATTNQVLEWNGTSWAPTTIAGSTPAWDLTGNSGIDTTLNFLGTTDAKNLIIKTNGAERLRVMGSGTNPGFIGIGIKNPTSNLHIVASNATSLTRFNNSNANGYGAYGINSAATGTLTGSGVAGVTAQSNGFAFIGQNTSSTGIGIDVSGAGLANLYQTPSGAGAEFSGYNFGLLANAVNDNLDFAGQAAITATIGNPTVSQDFINVFVNYYDGATQYKIAGTGTMPVSCTVPDLDGNQREMYAPESPDFLFSDYGEGKLVNGTVHIDIDPIYAKSVVIDDKHPLRVFIQLEDNENCKGVVVKNKTATGFDVVELNGGTSSTPFQWQIVCNVKDSKLPGGKTNHLQDVRYQKALKPMTTKMTSLIDQTTAIQKQTLLNK